MKRTIAIKLLQVVVPCGYRFEQFQRRVNQWIRRLHSIVVRGEYDAET